MKKICLLLPLLLAGCVSAEDQASIGIIGGADGPTAVFVSRPLLTPATIAAAVVILLMIVGAIAAIVISHKHK